MILSSGAHRGQERLGQPSAALGCPGKKDKPVVLFGSPADFKSGTPLSEVGEPVSVGVTPDPKIQAPILKLTGV